MATLTVMGVDVSAYVTDWGEIEDIKEVLLAKTQLFSGEHSIKLSNPNGEFSPFKSGSLFYGKQYFQSEVTIEEDGELVFDGLLKSVEVSKSGRDTRLLLENYLSIPTSRLTELSALDSNPTLAALGILQGAGLRDRVNEASFLSASAKTAGATIDINFAGTTTTVLSAVQDLCELASVALYVRNGVITAKAVEPYQGNNSSLRFPINTSNTVMVEKVEEAFENVKNVVVVTYSGGSATYTDPSSITFCRGQRLEASLNYGSGSIVIGNAASAAIYGAAFLERAAVLRRKISVTGSDDLRMVRVGDRHPITDSYFGFDNEPAEVIETRRSIQTKTINLVFATLR